jgi:hypothetical protein
MSEYPLFTSYTSPIMFRPATLRSSLPVLSRQTQSLRFATAQAAVEEITSNEASDPTKPNWTDLHNPAIKKGVKAFVLEVPRVLPDNEFNARRKAVEEHAHCESWLGMGG